MGSYPPSYAICDLGVDDRERVGRLHHEVVFIVDEVPARVAFPRGGDPLVDAGGLLRRLAPQPVLVVIALLIRWRTQVDHRPIAGELGLAGRPDGAPEQL